MNINNILDNDEEKINFYENSTDNPNLKNYSENKSTIDYVSLIMARNYGDWKLNENDDQNHLIDKKNDICEDDLAQKSFISMMYFKLIVFN